MPLGLRDDFCLSPLPSNTEAPRLWVNRCRTNVGGQPLADRGHYVNLESENLLILEDQSLRKFRPIKCGTFIIVRADPPKE